MLVLVLVQVQVQVQATRFSRSVRRI